MIKIILRSVLCVLCSVFLILPSLAIPGQMNYQGVLKDSSGNPLTGSYSMVFTIYDAASGGTSLWTETQTVSAEAGLYNIQLGSSTALASSVFDGSTRYLGVKVGSDAEMTPRVVLVTVPYAFRAGTADSVSGLSGSYVHFGTDEAQTTDEKYGLYVRANRSAGDTTRYGVYGATTGEGFTAGVYGLQNSGNSGAGVFARSPSAMGVYSDTDSGIAFYGNSDTGTVLSGAGAYGISVNADGENGFGLSATADHTSGVNYGVSATTHSSSGYALYGNANASSGTTYGLYAINHSPDGYGVYGAANDSSASGSSYGVYGYNNSGGGANNHGVYGITYAPGSSGVYGRNGNGNGIAVTVDDVLFLVPRDEPTGDADIEGAMYYDGTSHQLFIRTDSGWYALN